MKRTAIRFGMAALVAAGLVSAAPAIGSAPAFASGGGGGVQVAGTCSGTSLSSLKAKIDDTGQIEVEFQVDSNVAGQTWRVAMADNGTIFFTGKRVTQAPSGSFTVRKLTANLAGPDKIKAAAKNVAGGELCTAALSI